MHPIATISAFFADLPLVVGYLLILLIAMGESGLFIGIFLPGDTMLIATGILAAQGYLALPLLLSVIFLGAILGDSIAYLLGRRYGAKIFSRPQSWIFSPASGNYAKDFYARYGGKTVLLGRFIPVVRAFAPGMAGVAKMPYRIFFIYNIIGAALWTGTLVLAGYWVGERATGFRSYIWGAALIIAAALFLPSLIRFILDKSMRERLVGALKKIFRNR